MDRIPPLAQSGNSRQVQTESYTHDSASPIIASFDVSEPIQAVVQTPYATETIECPFIGELASLAHHFNTFTTICFSPNGCWIAAASLELQQIFLYDTENVHKVFTFKREIIPTGRNIDNGFEKLIFSKNGEYLVASGSNFIYIYNVHTLELDRVIEKTTLPQKDYSECIALSSDGKWMVYLQRNSPTLYQPQLRSMIAPYPCIRSLASNKNHIQPVFLPCNTWLACAGNGIVHIYSTPLEGQPKALPEIQLKLESQKKVAAPSSSSTHLASNSHLYAQQIAAQAKTASKYAIPEITALAVSSNGRWLAVGNISCAYDDSVRFSIGLWQTVRPGYPPERFRCTLRGHTAKIDLITFSENSQWLASVSKHEHTIRIWSPQAAQCLATVQFPSLFIEDCILQETPIGCDLIIRSFKKFYRIPIQLPETRTIAFAEKYSV